MASREKFTPDTSGILMKLDSLGKRKWLLSVVQVPSAILEIVGECSASATAKRILASGNSSGLLFV